MIQAQILRIPELQSGNDPAGCCGLGTLSGFSYNGRGLTLANIRSAERRARSSYGKKGMMYATLTLGQSEAAVLLKQAGWTKATEFVNPNSGNTVSFWYKLFNQPVRKKAKAA